MEGTSPEKVACLSEAEIRDASRREIERHGGLPGNECPEVEGGTVVSTVGDVRWKVAADGATTITLFRDDHLDRPCVAVTVLVSGAAVLAPRPEEYEGAVAPCALRHAEAAVLLAMVSIGVHPGVGRDHPAVAGLIHSRVDPADGVGWNFVTIADVFASAEAEKTKVADKAKRLVGRLEDATSARETAFLMAIGMKEAISPATPHLTVEDVEWAILRAIAPAAE